MLVRLLRLLAWIIKPFVISLDWALNANERDGSLSSISYLLWVAANIAAVCLLFYFIDEPWVLTATSGLIFFHVAIIAAALLIIYEETRHWEGLAARSDKILPGNSSVRRIGVLAISSIVLVLLAGVLCEHLDRFTSFHIIKNRTDLGCETGYCRYLEYILVCLDQMPFVAGPLRFTLERMGIEYHVTFLPVSSAMWFRVALYIATGTWILGAFRLLMQQTTDVQSLCEALETCSDAERTRYLQTRAARAPGFIKRKIVHGALTHPNPIVRHRYISTCYYARILTFPQTFLHNLPDQTEENKDWGLRQCLRILEEEHTLLDTEFRQRILNSVFYQIRNGDHSAGVVTDLWQIATLLAGDLQGPEKARANARMLSLATEPLKAPKNYEPAQKRLIDLCVKAGYKAFPQTFLFNIENHSDEVIQYGLVAIIQYVENGGDIDAETVRNCLARAAKKDVTNPELAKLGRLILPKLPASG